MVKSISFWLVFRFLFSSVFFLLVPLFCFLRFTCVLVLLQCCCYDSIHILFRSLTLSGCYLNFQYLFFFATKAYQIDTIYAFLVLQYFFFVPWFAKTSELNNEKKNRRKSAKIEKLKTVILRMYIDISVFFVSYFSETSKNTWLWRLCCVCCGQNLCKIFFEIIFIEQNTNCCDLFRFILLHSFIQCECMYMTCIFCVCVPFKFVLSCWKYCVRSKKIQDIFLHFIKYLNRKKKEKRTTTTIKKNSE